MAWAGGGRAWADDIGAALEALTDPSREDLFVLLVTWLQRHGSVVATDLRRAGLQLVLIEPLPRAAPDDVLRDVGAGASRGRAPFAAALVAAARALDLELANLDPVLLAGQHTGIGGDRYRVRPRVVPGGIDDLFGEATDDPTFGVARRMACVPVERVGGAGGVRLVDALALAPPALTRLARRREEGSIRVLVDALAPDEAQWSSTAGWVRVQRRHDDAMAGTIDEIVDHARAAEADILVLPELALEPGSLAHLARALAGRRRGSPCLTIAGLCHADSPAGTLVLNEAVALDVSGREVIRHRKLVAFATGQGDQLDGERLLPGDEVAVLATPVGNLSVLINEDLFGKPPRAALRVGYVTWLLVPSLSPLTARHRDRIGPLGERRITTVVCNAWPDDAVRQSAAPHVAGGPTLAVATEGERRFLFEVPV